MWSQETAGPVFARIDDSVYVNLAEVAAFREHFGGTEFVLCSGERVTAPSVRPAQVMETLRHATREVARGRA